MAGVRRRQEGRRALSGLLRAGAILLGAGVVWAASAELPWPARGLTAFLLAVLPPLSVLQLPAPEELHVLPRTAVYQASGAALWALAGVTLAAAAASGFPPELLGLRGGEAGALLGWGAGATAFGLALLALVRLAGMRESSLLRHLLPRSRAERGWFVGLSFTAGITEELVFRGFLVPALAVATGSLGLAAVLAAGAFGVAHAYQRPAGALRAAALGLVLTAPFLATGSLLPSMAAHAAIDLIAGLGLARWLAGPEA